MPRLFIRSAISYWAFRKVIGALMHGLEDLEQSFSVNSILKSNVISVRS